MAEQPKAPPPPIAIRITRPYADEESFLARELETLSRTSIVLLGAQPRPQGVVLRFELALQNGTPLVRGEGRVTGYRDNFMEGLPGLTLRFTRLDSRSKALVDRAAAMRDARSGRGSGEHAAVASPVASPAPPPTAPDPPAALAAPPSTTDELPTAAALDLESTRAEVPVSKKASDRPPPPAAPLLRPARASSVRPQPTTRVRSVPPAAKSEPLDLESTRAEAPRSKSHRPPPTAGTTPAREDALQRLRQRARSLDETKVRAILEQARRR